MYALSFDIFVYLSPLRIHLKALILLNFCTRASIYFPFNSNLFEYQKFQGHNQSAGIVNVLNLPVM
jgi:hypothetical protein